MREILFLVGSGTIRKASHDLLGRKNWLCSSHICIFHWPLPVITVQIHRLSAHVNVVSVWTKFNGNQTLVWSGMLIGGMSHGLYHYPSRCGEESSPSVLKSTFLFPFAVFRVKYCSCTTPFSCFSQNISVGLRTLLWCSLSVEEVLSEIIIGSKSLHRDVWHATNKHTSDKSLHRGYYH